jgi:hypothetical protein
VRNAQHRIAEIAEQAMAHTLAGDARATVKALITHGERTGNVKLIDTARLTLHRYRDRIADADELSSMVELLRARYGNGSITPPLGQNAGRSAGGLSLRAATCGPAADSRAKDRPAAEATPEEAVESAFAPSQLADTQPPPMADEAGAQGS